MEIITELVRNLALFMLAAAFMELLLPKGHLSSLLRLVLGLLLLAALLTPLLRGLGRADELESWARQLAEPPELAELPRQADTYAQQGTELAQSLQEAAREDYQRDLARQIAALAQSKTVAGRVEVETRIDEQGQLQGVTLRFRQTSPENAASCAAQLASELGLNEEQLSYQVLSSDDDGEGLDEKE